MNLKHTYFFFVRESPPVSLFQACNEWLFCLWHYAVAKEKPGKCKGQCKKTNAQAPAALHRPRWADPQHAPFQQSYFRLIANWIHRPFDSLIVHFTFHGTGGELSAHVKFNQIYFPKITRRPLFLHLNTFKCVVPCAVSLFFIVIKYFLS